MIVVLCASHIDTEERLYALSRTIQSLYSNTQTCKVIISLSCFPVYMEIIDAFITRIGQLFENVTILHQGFKHLRQFEHYALLSKLDGLSDYEWCMFTDDDDFSHPSRIETYERAIKDVGQEIGCVYAARAQSNVCANDAWQMTAEDITRHGHVSDGGQEYFMFATRTRVFQHFCDHVGSDILSLRECDLLFRNFMRCLPCYVFQPTSWLYAHTMVTIPLVTNNHMKLIASIWSEIGIPRLIDFPGFSTKHLQKHVELLSHAWTKDHENNQNTV